MSDLRQVRDERYVLAVDLGTGGPKVGFVSLAGSLVWQDHLRTETRWLGDGGATQDAATWWDLVKEAASRGLATGVVPADAVVAVSVTGMWACTVPVADDGTPVGDCILWMDTRGAPFARKVIAGPVAGYSPRPALQWIRRSGGAPSTSGADPIGHMLYLQHSEPDVMSRTRWFLEPIDYLAMRFTGVAAATHASMTAAWLTDNRSLSDLSYDPVLVAMSGVDGGKLPPLRPTGSVIGPILDTVADEIGLPRGVQVVTSTPDLHSAACGAGAVEDYATHLAISTSAWIGAPVPFKKTDPLRSIASVPGLDPRGYMIANNHETGGLSLQWLRDDFLGSDADYPALIEEATKSSPGAGEILFTPWLNGERSPVDDRYARAGFHNLSLATRRADVVRAVLEGVAYNNRWLHEAVERFAKRRLDPVRMIGGGAQSDLWCQIHADVMDRTIEKVAVPLHAGIRGAALFAAMSLGAVDRSELRGLVEIEATFKPDPANRAVYDRLYAEFPKLYKAQRPLSLRLNRKAVARDS
ncbi:MAG TPA: FGGY-family carbohydrate kinase [Acidimicrobiales bacterium]|nr:FGGY-family carbohydrate kinase [Acidimicrobiales bacterium]